MRYAVVRCQLRIRDCILMARIKKNCPFAWVERKGQVRAGEKGPPNGHRIQRGL